MQTRSRRAFLNSAAVAAVASLPGCMALAPAAASIRPPEPDAELIRLGIEFDRAEAAWIPLWREWQRHERLWRETIEARGMSLAEHGADAVQSVFDEAGGNAASDANDEALARLYDLRERMLAIQPTTTAGLAARAKVLRFDGVSPFDREKPAGRRENKDAAILDFVALVEDLAAQAVQS